MKKFRNFSKGLFKNKKGQGATEYILLLVVVVALVVMFKERIKGIMDEKIGQLSEQISNVTP